ncbi:hypothetical protein IFM89_016985 [Coptis chinensis]|uniref:Peptidase A1 domain-containing protein n=1 Tax=Coptis chinensis TaxID=261450 RepID=A0A835LRG4_9MAGN|nr:hypothetical protein IFM89_016985 [Coptis chinensis]
MALRSSHEIPLSGAFAFLVICLFTLNIVSASTTRPKGFSLNLIPKYAKGSPMHQISNLTEEEMYEKILKLSYDRAYRLSSELSYYAIKNRETTNISTYPEELQPDVRIAFDSLYVVELKIGTPPQQFYLDFDSGSDLTWVQCAGCTKCFPVRNGDYEYSQSSTYEYSTCQSSICTPQICEMNKCLYEIGYGDGITKGVYLNDDFSFFSPNAPDNIVTYSGLSFGCSLNTTFHWGGDNDGPANVIAGIFGMGRGPKSFMSSKSEDDTFGKFSYCLKRWFESVEGSLSGRITFGDDISFPGGSDVRSTPMVGSETELGHAVTYYYVNCIDISVGGVKLNLPPETFRLKPNGSGMILDTGSAITYIYRDVYNRMEAQIKQFLSRYNLQPWQGVGKLSGMLCYVRPVSFQASDLPTLTFHFDGADFDPAPEAVFLLLDDHFCLEIVPTDGALSIVGSYTQSGHQFVHDIPEGKISFAKANC